VRFEVTEPLLAASWCHCTRCRRRTGSSASPNAGIAPGSLRVVSGEELVRWYRPPEGIADAFCSACGSHLWSRGPDDADVSSIQMGALDGDPGIRPMLRQFVAYAAPWDPIPDDGLPRHDERAP